MAPSAIAIDNNLVETNGPSKPIKTPGLDVRRVYSTIAKSLANTAEAERPILVYPRCLHWESMDYQRGDIRCSWSVRFGR